MKHAIWQYLPRSLRRTLIRRGLNVEPRSEGYAIHFASTRDELEGAFRLLHNTYVSQRLMKPHPSGLRCNIYQAAPYTTTIIAKDRGRVVGTVSVIRDSSLGFPSDKAYRRENDHYRALGFRMCEISALAIHPDYRGRHGISLGLMKYLFFYATQYMDRTMLCATIHPLAFDFYQTLFNFKKNGEVIRYEFAEGAPAVHITTDCLTVRDWIRDTYGRTSERQNLYRSIFERDDLKMVYPNRKHGCTLDPVMTAELLEYFFVAKTETFREARPKELAIIKSTYELHFALDGIPYLNQAESERSFRYPISGPVVVIGNKSTLFCGIGDVSHGGMFVAAEAHLSIGQEYEVMFNLGESSFRIPAAVRWKSAGTHLRPEGYGLQFLSKSTELKEALGEIHRQPTSCATSKAVGIC